MFILGEHPVIAIRKTLNSNIELDIHPYSSYYCFITVKWCGIVDMLVLYDMTFNYKTTRLATL